jgi:hypothetical protein
MAEIGFRMLHPHSNVLHRSWDNNAEKEGQLMRTSSLSSSRSSELSSPIIHYKMTKILKGRYMRTSSTIVCIMRRGIMISEPNPLCCTTFSEGTRLTLSEFAHKVQDAVVRVPLSSALIKQSFHLVDKRRWPVVRVGESKTGGNHQERCRLHDEENKK